MIENLEKTFEEVKEYRKTMHEGTTSVLVDNWILITDQMIKELKLIESDKNA